MKTVLFSGGGSAGHLTPAIAIAEALIKLNADIRPVFACADRADETSVLKAAGYEYRTVRAGKFPRGLSFRLLTFPALSVLSVIQSIRILREEKPALVLSKGGYVSVPLCIAAMLKGVPVVLHSSDSVPSLSDRFLGRMAKAVCTGFPSDEWPPSLRPKTHRTGNPVRSMIGSGTITGAQRITGFSGRRPVVMVIGGSQGSLEINRAVERQFQKLLDLADIIHLTGAGKGIAKEHARYWSRPFVTDELPHLYAMTDVVVTRAGAGVLAEIATLKKAAVVIPLQGVAHDHQVKNAEALAAAGAAVHLPQHDIDTLPEVLRGLLADAPKRESLGKCLSDFFPQDAASAVARVTLDVLAASPIQS